MLEVIANDRIRIGPAGETIPEPPVRARESAIFDREPSPAGVAIGKEHGARSPRASEVPATPELAAHQVAEGNAAAARAVRAPFGEIAIEGSVVAIAEAGGERET